MDLYEQLRNRGLIEQSSNNLADHLNSGKQITFYVGFDPTAISLHIGNLVQLITMKRLLLAGHKPIAVIGGATGLIGDPEQSGERKMNPVETVAKWVETIKVQFKQILGADIQIVNNLDWTADVMALEFLRDIGKYFRISNMIAKETVAARLQSPEGISYTEFSYQILQAWDFLNLYKKYNCSLQFGGNDQWGNLTAGVDLIHKATGENAYCFTTPLITKADGSKFGKTEAGTVWLDANLTSPYQFYQFWFNAEDSMVEPYLKVFTFLSDDEIAAVVDRHKQEPHLRLGQKTLAYEVTALVHGKDITEKVIASSKALFAVGDNEITSEQLAMLTTKTIAKNSSLFDLLTASGVVNSNNDARTAIKQNAISINGNKITDPMFKISDAEFLFDKYLIIKKGKKTIKVVVVE